MIVRVALAVPPKYILEYWCDDENVALFHRVIVPVGKRKLIGFIVEKNVSIDYEKSKLKELCLLDDCISVDIQNTIVWLSKYYCCDIYSVIRLALPNDFLKNEVISPHTRKIVSINENGLVEHSLTSKQQDVITYLKNVSNIDLEELSSLYSKYVIKKLLDKKALQLENVISQNSNSLDTIIDQPRKLSLEQSQALSKINNKHGFNVSLLYGVTGSGKTEIYLQAIDKILSQGKQVLVLIPEINLTPQTVGRFISRFHDKQIVSLHSKLSDKVRLTNWLNIKNGQADIVIATRSGVLSDFASLGMIVVDEEHDSSFKQQTSTIRYSARDIAIYRAKNLGIPIILGSATPSIESYYNAISGKYQLIKIMSKALNSFDSAIHLIDLKESLVDNGISRALFSAIENTINKHEQALVFVNKLGFAKALVCKSCGTAVECDRCDKPYTLHTHPYQYLACHFCGTRKQLVIACPSCNAVELFTLGTGTEKIESRLNAKFPYNEIVRFDRQNIKTIGDLESVNEKIHSKQIDVIVGTQMIAKGHHFENITLIGLVNIDSGLYSNDFHALESTAQLIVQVSGRTSRADKPGVVLLQTYQPENQTLQKLITSDYLEFLDYLLEQRKFAAYPPYTYQAQIIAESRKENELLVFLQELYSQIVVFDEISVAGPIPAMHLKRNNTYRYSLLITSSYRKNINILMNWVKDNVEIGNTIKMYFDIDPIEIS